MQLGCLVMESGRVWLGSPEQVLKSVREVHGETHIQQALAGGRGVIIAAPHLGCWEMVNYYLSSRYPLTAMYRPQAGAVDQVILDSRERMGATLVPADRRGVRALSAALKRDELIGILPDQDPGAGGVFVDFFGVSAHSPVLLSKLANKSGAQVILAYAARLPGGRGFDLHFRLGSPVISDVDVSTATAALNRDVEACIREIPDQYLWTYRRFRRRPPGEPAIYPRRRRKKKRAAPS